MKKITREKGITLIALIITIIVMLILVGVTINVALNGGLFDKAKNAATETEKESIYEQIVMGMQLEGGKINVAETFAEAQDTLSGYTVTEKTSGTNYQVITVQGKNGTYTYTITSEGISIGENIPQEPPQNTPEIGQVNNQSGTALQFGDFITYNNETWVVLYNDEDNGLQIVSKNPKPGIELASKNGYNSAIQLLNAECEKYMTTGAEYARIMGTSPTVYKDGVKTELDENGMNVADTWTGDISIFPDLGLMNQLLLEGVVNSENDFIIGLRNRDAGDEAIDYFMLYFNTLKSNLELFKIYRLELKGTFADETYATESLGIFPVIVMNKNIEITGGDGTTIPYTYTSNQ